MRERVRGTRPGDQLVRVRRPEFGGFARQGLHLEASLEIEQPKGFLGSLWRFLVGTPIHTALESHERLTKVKALAVFSSDALSSVAYAPQAVLIILLAAGTSALTWSFPISICIVGLLTIVATSYRQTIYAYPSGGGSYIVAHANLGPLPGLAAAGALAVGYILTVSVSIASGVDQIIAGVPALAPYRVEAAVLCIALITIANLRGIRESGSIFAAPTYLFLLGMYSLIIIGLYLHFTGNLHIPASSAPPAVPVTETVSLWLLLRAFATGSAVMTGTEAISNGVPAFKPPESHNAARTLIAMATILGTMFLGLAYLIVATGVVPTANDTTIAQLARGVFGDGPVAYGVIATTALILVLAANTAFADFPRLASLLARDDYAPHQLAFRADRLAFANGILLLGVLASLLVILFGGRTDALLPLYAVGVFLAFTLSQSGMVRHWWRERGQGWRVKMVVNGVGATVTALVALIAAATNFVDLSNPIVPGTHFGWWGAWLVIVVVPAFIWMFLKVHEHYQHERAALALPDAPPPESEAETGISHIVVVPISQINKATLRALDYADSMSQNVIAVHVSIDQHRAAELEAQWRIWGKGVPLTVINSPYRSLQRPLLRFLLDLKQVEKADVVTVILPEYVPSSWWGHVLHSQSALRLKGALLFTPGFVVTSVPYHEPLGDRVPRRRRQRFSRTVLRARTPPAATPPAAPAAATVQPDH